MVKTGNWLVDSWPLFWSAEDEKRTQRPVS
jgi:hypothetical protein